MNDLLITSGRNIDVLYANCCILTETIYEEGVNKREKVEEMLGQYTLIQANICVEETIDDFTEYVEGVKVVYSHSTINTEPDTYPSSANTCLCSKSPLSREFKLKHNTLDHSIILGSSCIRKFIPGNHTLLSHVKTIEKAHQEYKRTIFIQKSLYTLLPDLTLQTPISKTNKRQLLLELTIRILRNMEWSQHIHEYLKLGYSHPPYKASYYYGLVFTQLQNGTLTQRNANNVRKEKLYRALEHTLVNWKKLNHTPKLETSIIEAI